jgi:hypothetical protein
VTFEDQHKERERWDRNKNQQQRYTQYRKLQRSWMVGNCSLGLCTRKCNKAFRNGEYAFADDLTARSMQANKSDPLQTLLKNADWLATCHMGYLDGLKRSTGPLREPLRTRALRIKPNLSGTSGGTPGVDALAGGFDGLELSPCILNVIRMPQPAQQMSGRVANQAKQRQLQPRRKFY